MRYGGRTLRGALLGIFLAFFAACFGDDDETEKTKSVRAKELNGPIVGLVVAESVDEQGRPVDPGFTFPKDRRQVAVIVHVGKVTGSPLTIAWYRGEKKLFAHTVEAKSYVNAFSIGRNPGLLAAGTYRVEAALEGTKREVEWDVSGGAAARAANAATSGGAPVSGGSGAVEADIPQYPGKETFGDAFRLVQTDNFGGRAVFVAPIAGRSTRAGFPTIPYLTGSLTLQCATCPA
jgi:hypothetical protein